LLIKRQSSTYQVVMHWFSWTVAWAHFSTSGVTSEIRWPEWGILWSSTFPVTSCRFHPLSKGASVEGSTSINIEKVFVDVSLVLGNKEFVMTHCGNTHHWLTHLWGAAAGMLSEVYDRVYKCQKLDISFIKNLALPTFLPTKKNSGALLTVYPVYFMDFMGVCAPTFACLYICKLVTSDILIAYIRNELFSEIVIWEVPV
jgi:hypothetical protein